MNRGLNQITKYVTAEKKMLATHRLTNRTRAITLDHSNSIEFTSAIFLASFPPWRVNENMGTLLMLVLDISVVT